MDDAEEQDHTKLDPRDSYEKPPIYKEDPDLEVPYPLLCGEHVLRIGKTTEAIFILSKYRFFVKYKNSFTNIPVRLIEQLEVREHFLIIQCKDGKTYKVKFSSDAHCLEWSGLLQDSSHPPKLLTDFFAFCFHAWCFSEKGDGKQAPGMDFLKPGNAFEYDFSKERDRLGFNIGDGWRVYKNTDFKHSTTYPEQHIVPAKIKDEDIRKICKFRSKGRFPSVVWRHPRNGAVIVRCGQPEVSVFNWRCKEDERLIDSFLQACSTDGFQRCGPSIMNGHAVSSDKESNLQLSKASLSPSKRVLILDLRSYASAYANKLKGGGYEYEDYYETSETLFMGLVNIHSIRKSFQSLRTLCSSATESSSNWLSKLESTEWLNHLALLLKSAHVVVNGVHKEGRPIVIHCTDGWDRTTQVVGLAEIMLDPYYRTLEGIQVLIEREWLDFGHQFATRCGNDTNDNDLNGRSPVFLQWLDCLHQLIKQFPTAFEFNETFLIKLAEHVYSCLFGTFLCNTKKERLDCVVQENTCSVWAILQVEALTNKNFLFDPKTDHVLHPSWNICDLHFWSKLFMSESSRSEVEDGSTWAHSETSGIGSPKLPRTRSFDDIHKTVCEDGERRASFVETTSLARTSSDPNLSDLRLEEFVGTPPKGTYMISSTEVESKGGTQESDWSNDQVETAHSDKNEKIEYKTDEQGIQDRAEDNSKIMMREDSTLLQSLRREEVIQEIHMQSSTDTVTEETPRDAPPPPTLAMCNGYHSEELTGIEDGDRNHNNSENHLVLKKSSNISTSTSDISNSHIECRSRRLRNRSSDPKEVTRDAESSLRNLRIKSSESHNHVRVKDRNGLSTSPTSLFRSRCFSGPRSPSDRNCPLRIGKHLDEDGLTNISSANHRRLVEIMIISENEKETLREEIFELREQLKRCQVDCWHDYHGLSDKPASYEVATNLTVEDDELTPSSVPNSLHSDASWEQLDDRDQSQTLWVPDHAVTHCPCGHKFNLITRRHHCRNCGRIFCGTCSNFFIAIPREQLFHPQRVCSQCHSSLEEQQPQSSRLCSSQTSLDKDGNFMKAVTVIGQG
ncbi:phosphatidylinositol-3,5-bisphosphate 3-phosphatase MTMR3-like [Apostichopus japonicus]|uniref:phosphatidylinositol-3,5-bisphosphate 3-phosphatase MTMR3-like n=1 Tax=Stichopus japonicus TaxID=307972 RepID=UPI003AB1DED9